MLSILLCDDDPLFLNELQATITQILPQEQLSFTCCTKGADCMEAVQRGLIPDVAFVDIALPDVDGISVAAQIYQCCPSIRFFFYYCIQQPIFTAGIFKGYKFVRLRYKTNK